MVYEGQISLACSQLYALSIATDITSIGVDDYSGSSCLNQVPFLLLALVFYLLGAREVLSCETFNNRT
jgi:hypothetical protein